MKCKKATGRDLKERVKPAASFRAFLPLAVASNEGNDIQVSGTSGTFDLVNYVFSQAKNVHEGNWSCLMNCRREILQVTIQVLCHT